MKKMFTSALVLSLVVGSFVVAADQDVQQAPMQEVEQRSLTTFRATLSEEQQVTFDAFEQELSSEVMHMRSALKNTCEKYACVLASMKEYFGQEKLVGNVNFELE